MTILIGVRRAMAPVPARELCNPLGTWRDRLVTHGVRMHWILRYTPVAQPYPLLVFSITYVCLGLCVSSAHSGTSLLFASAALCIVTGGQRTNEHHSPQTPVRIRTRTLRSKL